MNSDSPGETRDLLARGLLSVADGYTAYARAVLDAVSDSVGLSSNLFAGADRPEIALLGAISDR